MSSHSRAARLYDLLYGEFKVYHAATVRLLDVFAASGASVRRVLEVACGTGMQAKSCTEPGLRVDGLDLEPGFVCIAQDRNAAGLVERRSYVAGKT